VRVCVAALLFAFPLGLAAGCGGDDGHATEASSLADVPWIVSSGLDVPGWESVRPSATFADGTVGGSTGCNRFTASYTVDGDALEIGTIASTKIACPPPADAVEREYLDALGRVAGWRLENQDLLLLDSDGAELLRYRAATPVGDWHATVIQTGLALVSPLPGTEVTARFAADGTLTGSAGCNTYRTTYTTTRGGIEIAPPAATKKACSAPDGILEQEAAYLAALPTANHYRVDGDSLALLRPDETFVASYVRAP
jgi:heat shock protein HslJ